MRTLYNKFFSVDTLARIMATVTPLLIMKEYITQQFRSLLPSYIERIVHFDTQKGTTNEVYVGWRNMYSMKRATYELLGLTREGYYMFVIWNKMQGIYEHILLRGELVEKALEIKNIYNMWALHEQAIVLLLSNYVRYASINKDNILGLTLNRKDVTKRLKPFMLSLNIEDNVCPSALYMLLAYLDNDLVHMLTMKTSICTYMNYDMEEMPIPYADQYIISSNLASHPVTPCAPTMYEDIQQATKDPAPAPVPVDIQEDLSEVEELHEQPAAPSEEPIVPPEKLSCSAPTKSYRSLMKNACMNLKSPHGGAGRSATYAKNKAV